MRETYGVDSMPETAENIAQEYKISRTDQDLFALRSQFRWKTANKNNIFASEIVPIEIIKNSKLIDIIDSDEHPRPSTNKEKLKKLSGVNGAKSTVTAGNASGINDGAAAMLIASKAAAR